MCSIDRIQFIYDLCITYSNTKDIMPPKDNKRNAKEVPVIQLVPPVLFIRRRKRTLVFRLVRKLMPSVFLNKKLRKVEGCYADSKRVYVK